MLRQLFNAGRTELFINVMWRELDTARSKFEIMRWGKDCEDVACSHCGPMGQPNCYRVRSAKGSSTHAGLWRCRTCKSQFTVTKGTVFQHQARASEHYARHLRRSYTMV